MSYYGCANHSVPRTGTRSHDIPNVEFFSVVNILLSTSIFGLRLLFASRRKLFASSGEIEEESTECERNEEMVCEGVDSVNCEEGTSLAINFKLKLSPVFASE